MTLFRAFLPAILFCLFTAAPLSAQNILITFGESDTLFVCGTDTFFIQVQNTGATPLNDAVLKVTLTAGTGYVPESVAGAAEQNVSNLQQPAFALPALPAGQTASVSILLSANCEAAGILDTGQLFLAAISVESPAGNAQISGLSIPVETGLLLIESIDNQLMSGEKGDTLLRKICVKNTRIGKIGNLYFEDEHVEGFGVYIDGASDQTNNPVLYKATFSGNFIAGFGDGDQWLENGEKACFTERIAITDCGIPEYNNPSTLRAGWGCGGETCRYDSALAAIAIKKSTRVPNLVFSPVWNPPTDYCGNTPAATGVKIVNTGPADATDVQIGFAVVDSVAGFGMGNNSFRIVSGGVTAPLAVNLSSPGILTACGLPVLNSASVIVPEVRAGDSLLLLFDTYTCKGSCDQTLPLYSVEYFYRKPCPVNGFVSDTLFIAPDGAYLVGSFVGNAIGVCLQDGQTYPFHYEVVTKRLIEDGGFLHLELTMPSGLSFDDSCAPLLGGAAPVFEQTAPLPGGGFNVHLAWKLPLPNDSLDMTFCLRYDCDTNIVCNPDLPPPSGGIVIYSADCPVTCFLQLNSKTYWTPALNTPYECAIGDCDSLRLAVYGICLTEPDDNTDTITVIDFIFPLPGLKKWFDVYRLNKGFRDDNDDRHADNTLPAAAPGVRRDRFLPGDTLRVEYCGAVDSGGGLVKFGRSIWHEVIGSDMGGAAGNDFFNTASAQNGFANAGLFRFLRDSLSIRYADGSAYGCPLADLVFFDDKNYFTINQVNTWPPQKLDDLASQKFRFQFSLADLHASGCLPKGTLDAGDSIFIYTDFRLDMNYRPVSGNFPDPPLVGFRTALSDGGPLYAYNAQPFRKLQYSGFRTTKSPNTFSIKACENSVEVRPFRYTLRIARENMFPYEIRPLARIIDYFQTIPDGIAAFSARLDYLVLQDSVPFLNNVNLPFSQQADILSIDFSPAFSAPVDEGFALRTHVVFQPDCRYDAPDSSRQYFTVRYDGRLNGGLNPVADSVINAIGFYSNAPDLRFLTADSIATSPAAAFEVSFTLKNNTIPPAFNTWVYVRSKSGLSGDLKLFQMPQNQPVVPSNGIFQTGTLNAFDEADFRLAGTDMSCETDTLLIVFGWNCAPVGSPDQEACGRDTFLIELRVQKPELELEVTDEPSLIPLCDTSGYYEFKVYNAKSGYAFDPFATVKLPPGLSVAPGTSHIAYPAGAAFTPVADPQALPGNLYRWNIDDILPAVSNGGLPGVHQAPQNELRIRFRTIAECGFVSNTQLIYGTRGREACGRSTNVLNKPGDPLVVDGSNPVYGVQASLLPADNAPVYCGGAQQLSAKLTLLGTPSAGDSIYVALPAGLSYVAGSYQPQQNAPAGPPELQGQTLRLPVPAGLSPGTSVEFSFSVAFGQGTGCVDQSIVLQTRVRSEVFCPSLGGPCTVYAATGEAVLNVDPLHPELALTGTGAVVAGAGVDMTIAVGNIGTVPAPGVTVQIWYDADGNGFVSAGDSLLQTAVVDQPVLPGASVTADAVVGIDPGWLCNLLVMLPAGENCACADKLASVQNIQLQHEKRTFCEAGPSSVGVPAQPGFTYQWLTTAGIACPTCSATQFTPPANTQPDQTFTLLLEEKSPGCTVLHRFDVSFGTQSGINSGNASGCKGEAFFLEALPAGASYLWSGQGIADPAMQQQTVVPATTSDYTVIVVFPNGCADTLTKTITVYQPDTTVLAGITTCEGEPVSVPGTTTDIPGLYHSTFKTTHNCDSIVYQMLEVLPSPKIQENLSFCQGDTLFVFDTLLTQSGQLCRTYKTANGCDSLHCITATALPLPQTTGQDTIFALPGQPVPLEGPDGYSAYAWFPADSACLNCQNISVLPDSNGYFEYQLLVTDANGCEGLITYRIVVLPPCDPQRLRIPNAFTPNGDGVNDVFRVVPFEGLEMIGSLTIYDHWGEKVYFGSGNASWDGAIHGKPGPSDVYVYRIDIICDGKPEAVWGDVTLLR